MSESIVIALIGFAGTVIAAAIGLFAVIVAKGRRSRDHHRKDVSPTMGRPPSLFYIMIIGGVLNLAVLAFADILVAPMFRDEVIPVVKMQLAILSALAFAIAFFNRRSN